MSSQQHNHPLPLVPGTQAPAHRVDSHHDLNLQQTSTDEAPTYQSYRQIHASNIERTRKDMHRSHRVVEGSMYGRSVTASGIDVPKLKAVKAQDQYQARTFAPVSGPACARTRAQHHHKTHVASTPYPRTKINTIPSQHTHISHPQLHSAISSHIPLPYVQRKPLPPLSRAPKDLSRFDSLDSNAFVAAGQLSADVAVHLLKYVENERSKLEHIKQVFRGLWHGMKFT